MHRSSRVVKKAKTSHEGGGGGGGGGGKTKSTAASGGGGGGGKQTNLFDSFKYQKNAKDIEREEDSSKDSVVKGGEDVGQVSRQSSIASVTSTSSGPTLDPSPRPQTFGYVPDALHKNVQYSRYGEKKELTPQQKAVYRFVQQHFMVPLDIENNHKYGPLSGRSYEERVIGAYLHRLLDLRPEYSHLSPDDALLKACTTCGDTGGHVFTDCPEGL